MRRMAMLHRYRLKSTTLRTHCVMYLCMYFKTATALELLANNFCFSVKLFVGVAACDTSYILGKRCSMHLLP